MTKVCGEKPINSNRVNRGGSWNNDARNCSASNRDNNNPDNRNDDVIRTGPGATADGTSELQHEKMIRSP